MHYKKPTMLQDVNLKNSITWITVFYQSNKSIVTERETLLSLSLSSQIVLDLGFVNQQAQT